jgi:hypothetical protein
MIPHHDHHFQILHPSLKAQWDLSQCEPIHSMTLKPQLIRKLNLNSLTF